MTRDDSDSDGEAQHEGDSLDVLTRDECFRLLGTQEVGRLGVIVEHYPLIIPVNYALDDRVIVVRTSSGTKLSALDHANVTFEVDEIDRTRRTGWSVLVRGLAEEVTEAHARDLVDRSVTAGVSPWAPGVRDHLVRVIPHLVTGRRIHRAGDWT